MKNTFRDFCIDYESDYDKKPNAYDIWEELTRQIAELQALVKVKDEALETALVWLPDSKSDEFKMITQAFHQTSGTDALDKLIVEAEQRGYDKCWNIYIAMDTHSERKEIK